MKHIIVSGCARGIGEAAVRRFLAEGYKVTGMSRTDEETVRAKFGSDNFTYHRGDLSVASDRQALVAHALDTFGKIDGLVNVAGVAPRVRCDLLDMSEESYDTVMDINTKGTLFLTQAVAKEMIKNEPENGIRGYICNISSLSAYTSSPNRGEYCISKAGVSMITKLFADRLAEYGIPVNEVRPGIIATDMTEKVKEKYDTLIDGGLLPISRWGTPEDISSAVFALCSGALPYMTGQSLDVDGGFHIRRL
ncbi:MAG: 3-ketoacyl-ACP reductase [Ruminococcaceae bacterium]|nr:3-ketoacyl-ACP reductase [Oscillospiraceae bacterium]